MHLLVTDHLTCPRCGPAFGLILRADRMEDRRVLQGALGCSNCRERYPVEDGFGDLRPSPRGPESAWDLDRTDDPHEALKLAALLGVREGPGLLLLVGSSVRNAERLAAMVEGIEVVTVHPALRGDAESVGVTRITTPGVLPFRAGSVRGVVLDGGWTSIALAEGIRVLGPGSRLVLLEPPEDGLEQMESAGLELVLEAASVLVGVRK